LAAVARLTRLHEVHRIAVGQGVLNGFVWFVRQLGLWLDALCTENP